MLLMCLSIRIAVLDGHGLVLLGHGRRLVGSVGWHLLVASSVQGGLV